MGVRPIGDRSAGSHRPVHAPSDGLRFILARQQTDEVFAADAKRVRNQGDRVKVSSS